MLIVIVSLGALVKRNASDLSPPSPPDVRASSLRVIVSGLYWNTMTLAIGLALSNPTMAPLSRRGEIGAPFISYRFTELTASSGSRVEVDPSALPHRHASRNSWLLLAPLIPRRLHGRIG